MLLGLAEDRIVRRSWSSCLFHLVCGDSRSVSSWINSELPLDIKVSYILVLFMSISKDAFAFISLLSFPHLLEMCFYQVRTRRRSGLPLYISLDSTQHSLPFGCPKVSSLLNKLLLSIRPVSLSNVVLRLMWLRHWRSKSLLFAESVWSNTVSQGWSGLEVGHFFITIQDSSSLRVREESLLFRNWHRWEILRFWARLRGFCCSDLT